MQAIWQAGAFCIAYGLAAALMLFSLSEWFARLFSDEPAVIAATVRYLHISVWGYTGFGILIVVNGALNAVDKASIALALSIVRTLVVMVPIAWLLRAGLGHRCDLRRRTRGQHIWRHGRSGNRMVCIPYPAYQGRGRLITGIELNQRPCGPEEQCLANRRAYRVFLKRLGDQISRLGPIACQQPLRISGNEDNRY